MYYELSGDELELINDISKITNTEYAKRNDLIRVEYILTAMRDLLVSYESLDNEYEEFKNYIDGNYEKKEINPYEEYGISEREFREV